MFGQLSDSTFFHDKVDLFIACAPIVYLHNNKEELLHKAGDEWRNLYLATQHILKMYEVNDSFLVGFKAFCTMFNDICDQLYDWMHGETQYSDQEAEKLQQRMGMLSASTKQLLHLG